MSGHCRVLQVAKQRPLVKSSLYAWQADAVDTDAGRHFSLLHELPMLFNVHF